MSTSGTYDIDLSSKKAKYDPIPLISGAKQFYTRAIVTPSEWSHTSSVGMQYCVIQKYADNPKQNVVVAMFEYRQHALQFVKSFVVTEENISYEAASMHY